MQNILNRKKVRQKSSDLKSPWCEPSMIRFRMWLCYVSHWTSSVSVSLFVGAYVKDSTLEKEALKPRWVLGANHICPISAWPVAAVEAETEWVMCYPFKSNFSHANARHVWLGPWVKTVFLKWGERKSKAGAVWPFSHLLPPWAASTVTLGFIWAITYLLSSLWFLKVKSDLFV